MKWTDYRLFNEDTKRGIKEKLMSQWHRKFAWWPVKVGQDARTGSPIKVWLQIVEHKRTYIKTRIDNTGEVRVGFSYDRYREIQS